MATFALPELQAAFRAHLLGADRADLADAVVGDVIPPAGRLAIYRNHVRLSLTAALAATYPVVARLVGEAFFVHLAVSFIGRRPPAGPVLAEYGASFADHVAGEPAAMHLPYLADVARLEWALNQAWHAPFVPPLQTDDLTRLAAEDPAVVHLALQPQAAVLRSPWPVDRIWRTNQPGAMTEIVDLDRGGVCLLVLRGADDAVFLSLSTGEAAFAAALLAGSPLEAAAEAGFRADAGFSLAACFARLLAAQAFSAGLQCPDA